MTENAIGTVLVLHDLYTSIFWKFDTLTSRQVDVIVDVIVWNLSRRYYCKKTVYKLYL